MVVGWKAAAGVARALDAQAILPAAAPEPRRVAIIIFYYQLVM
jgi:hypothetical protein